MNSKWSLIVLCLISVVQLSLAQNKWDVASIPDSLKKNADVVVRFSQIQYNRQSCFKTFARVKKVITVLNSNGRSSANFNEQYDRNTKVTFLSGVIYDSKGNVMRKVKKKDLRDYASNSSYTLFSDHRLVYYKPSVNYKIFTVEYEYEIEYNGVVGYDTWLPQSGTDVAVQEAELLFNAPQQFDIKYRELNHQFTFTSTLSSAGVKIYSWKVSGLKALPNGAYKPGYLKIVPAILLTPNSIDYENTNGDFSSWNSYGNWVSSLVDGRDVLSEQTVATLHLLTDTIVDKREKVKVIYKYMQNRTRYVNIALGIGGFQPIEASVVDDKGYGDCKALSNYMKALLKAIGIESFYTEIGSGSNQYIMFDDFASANQTNHIILCVPMQKDSIWLECTSQTFPFGYIGGNNSDRYALLVKSSGAELVRTPVFKGDDNLRTVNSTIHIDENGNAEFDYDATFCQYLYEDIFGLIYDSPLDQKKQLLKNLDVEGLIINDFTIKDISDTIAKAAMSIRGVINNYGVVAGKRLIIQPSFMLPDEFPSHLRSNREIDFFVGIGYVYEDTIKISMPDNFIMESFPQNFAIDSECGNVSLSYSTEGKKGVCIIRKVVMNKGSYGLESLKEVNEFFKTINRRMNAKIVLLRKES